MVSNSSKRSTATSICKWCSSEQLIETFWSQKAPRSSHKFRAIKNPSKLGSSRGNSVKKVHIWLHQNWPPRKVIWKQKSKKKRTITISTLTYSKKICRLLIKFTVVLTICLRNINHWYGPMLLWKVHQFEILRIKTKISLNISKSLSIMLGKCN